MRVQLLAHTAAPEHLVASAARLCYAGGTVDEVRGALTDERAAQFVEMLAEIGHESPIEHASFTFGIEGVSRALLAQLTRHRLASFSVQSQRYVREGAFAYVTPPEIAGIPAAAAAFEHAMQAAQRSYDELVALLTAAGRDEKQAIEDARFVLPNACDTKLMLTMNARSLLNFFAHRCCNRAQWEIRELAWEMLRLCLEVAPHLFAKAGPPCGGGVCPEGKMSCGKASEVRKRELKLKGKWKEEIEPLLGLMESVESAMVDFEQSQKGSS